MVITLASRMESTMAAMDDIMWSMESIASHLESVDAPLPDPANAIQALLSEGSMAADAVEVRPALSSVTGAVLARCRVILCQILMCALIICPPCDGAEKC